MITLAAVPDKNPALRRSRLLKNLGSRGVGLWSVVGHLSAVCGLLFYIRNFFLSHLVHISDSARREEKELRGCAGGLKPAADTRNRLKPVEDAFAIRLARGRATRCNRQRVLTRFRVLAADFNPPGIIYRELSFRELSIRKEQ